MLLQLFTIIALVGGLQCKPSVVRTISGEIREAPVLHHALPFVDRLQHHRRWHSALSRQTFVHAIRTRMLAVEQSADGLRRDRQRAELLQRCVDQGSEELLPQPEHECQWPVVLRAERGRGQHGGMRRVSKSR